MSPRWQFRPVWAVIVIIALTLAAYLHTLRNPFVWDDIMLVQQNNYIRNARYIPAAFTTDLFHGDPDWDATHYRPLQTLTYMADYFLWGSNPTGYHLTNLLLHLGGALLLFALLQAWFARLPVSFAVAAIFAVHPINTNAITYVAGRADPLALFFMLAALWLLHRSRQRDLTGWGCYVAAQLAFLCALFGRENSALLPVLVFLYGALVGKQRHDWRGGLKLALPFVVLAVGYMLLRHEALAWQGRSTRASWDMPWTMRGPVICRALATYIGLFFWPATLQMQREVVFAGSWLTWAGVAVAISLAGLGVWAWRRSPAALLGLFWFVIAIAPMLGFVKLNATVAEHWAYVPSIGFYLMVAALVPRWRVAGHVMLAVALTALTARTAWRNHDWSDPLALLQGTSAAVPQHAAARLNYSRQLVLAGQTNAALTQIVEAERVAPAYAQGKTRLAWFLFEQGRLAEARGKVVEALRLKPSSTQALLLAAYIAEKQNESRTAERFYLRALGSTLNVRPWIQYGDFLYQQRRVGEARSVADAAVRIEPGSADAWNLRGIVLAELNDLAGADASFAEAVRCDRHMPDAWINRGRLALRRQLPTDAVKYFVKAATISPGDLRIRYHLAHALWRNGQRVAAEAELLTALEIAPDSERFRAALIALCHNEPNPFTAP